MMMDNSRFLTILVIGFVFGVFVSSAIAWQPVNGVPICTVVGNQYAPQIVSDTASGGIIAWNDARSNNLDIYAQRINANGDPVWTTDGVVICSATTNQGDQVIADDGAGGAIISWDDGRNGQSDIYAQRVNSNGVVQWATDGIAVCTATNFQIYPSIVSDGSDGAIVTLWDERNDGGDIYAQHVNGAGPVPVEDWFLYTEDRI